MTQLAPSGTVDANGQEMYYEIHGDGPPLVLVMGIGYDSSIWTLAQVPALSTQFQVILVDSRDAGRSSNALQPYAIVDMADDLVGLLDAPQDSADSPTGVVDGMDDPFTHELAPDAIDDRLDAWIETRNVAAASADADAHALHAGITTVRASAYRPTTRRRLRRSGQRSGRWIDGSRRRFADVRCRW